jgi:dipeptidyl aminopeptidase/acylaminoacyl peptidase
VTATDTISARYEAAAKLTPDRLAGLVRNDQVKVHWLPDDADWLWWRRDADEGGAFVLMDVAAGRREPAFDHEAAARALSALTGAEVSPHRLPVLDLAFDAERAEVTITTPTAVVRMARATGEVLSSRSQAPDPRLLVSPDGAQAVFRNGDDLWLRDLGTGEARALTTDGEPGFSYGKLPDLSMMSITVRLHAIALPPAGAVWSPDSRYVVAPRIDERAVREYPFLQSAPPVGAAPAPHVLRRAILGDRENLAAELVVIDTHTGEVRRVAFAEDWPDLSQAALVSALSADPSAWSSDASSLYIVIGTDWSKRAGVAAVDMATGRARVLVEETSETHLDLNPTLANRPNVQVLGDGAEVLWWSERDGFGHLYLHDGRTGALKRQLTRGEWVVFDLVHVDQAARRAYFTAGGREPGSDPYQRRLYAVSLDGGEPVLLTPEDADHMIAGRPHPGVAWMYRQAADPSPFSPSGRLFVDSWSTLDQPPVCAVRAAADGAIVAELERADASALWRQGYRPPQPFIALAADGTTPIHGVVHWPPDRGDGRKHPVIDALYAGPQTAVVPHNFRAYAARNLFGPTALAELGFVVVTLDARSTAMRSKAFHDHGYGDFGDGGLADHVAFIRQLAAAHPEVDADRVGVYGFSFGGYFAARALLTYPEVFKVAVSMAGSHNYQGMYAVLAKHHGKPVYSDGGPFRPDDSETPRNYRDLDNARLAANLKGRLLLVAGDLDENAPAAVTLQFADALIKADKPFDLLIMPNHDHYSMVSHPYLIRRIWDYFVEHLMNETPPCR